MGKAPREDAVSSEEKVHQTADRPALTAYEVDDLDRVVSREFTLEVTVEPEG